MAEKQKVTKKNTKTAKSVKKVVDTKETTCECTHKMLEKIFYGIIALIVIQALVLLTVVFKGTSINVTSSDSNQEVEEVTGEYDVSMFDTLSTSDAMKKISDGKKYVVYIGRSTCGYCVKFLPSLQQAQEEYGYKTIYIDLEKMTEDDQKNIVTLDNNEKYIEQNLGYTPMVLVFEKGKLKNGWVGYAEYESFASFLEDNGYQK